MNLNVVAFSNKASRIDHEIGIFNGIRATNITNRPFVWLNIVCLDAPLVAIAWQWLFARSFHVDVSASARGALFLTAWLIYLIDRLADSLSLPDGSARSLRHDFCLRHTKLWIGFALTIAVLDAIIVFWRLDHDVFLFGALLGGGALVYLTLNHAFNRLWEIVPLKEIAIGFLFAAGTLVVLMPQFLFASSGTERSTGAVAGFLFAALCSLNCMSIAVWERDLDRSQGKHSIATRWTAVGFWVRASCIVLAAAAFGLGVFDQRLLGLALCLAVSAVLLAILNSIAIQQDERTALADLVLLTPVVLLCAEMIL